jgi:hypothetical protein
MIIFEGDYVRLTNESHWLRVDEIVFVDADPANNKLRLSDDYVVPAPIEKYIEEYRSENEQMEAYAEEVRASDAIHHAEASQY